MGISFAVKPRICQRDVYGLAPTRQAALVQSREGSDRRVERGDTVDERKEGLRGRVAGESCEGHHPAQGLAYRVEANAVTIRAVLSVGRYVDHDDARIELFQHVVAEAHPLDRAWPEVLEQYVGDADEVTQYSLALIPAEIDREALLAAVVLDPVGALALDDRAVAAAFVPQ